MKRFLIILVNACLCAYLLVGGTLPVQASPLHIPVIFSIYLPLVIKSIAAPSATTAAATNISGTTARLNATVNANNGSTTVTFQYGLSTSYGSSVTATQSPVGGTADTAVSAAISGLTPNTPYHFRVVAVNTGGTGNGSDTTFTTSPIIATSISTGLNDSCVLTQVDGVKCWGYNYDGELGNNGSNDSLTPVDVSGLTSGVVAVTTGYKHSCALTDKGAVKCWGLNSYGQLGDGTTTTRRTPVAVTGLSSGVAGISANGNHTCAVTNAGAVKCWGSNDFGELGDGTTTSKSSPVSVSGLTSGVSVLKAGKNHTCALMSSHGVKCWGLNENGQLGDGSLVNKLTPVNVYGLTSGVSALTAGGSHSCALTDTGGVKCWGLNSSGQLGDNTTTTNSKPVDVSSMTSGVAAISAGEKHTCALLKTGPAKCWGINLYGQLGDGTTTNRKVPTSVSGLASGVTVIRAGYNHTCALLTSGGVRCWGDNSSGELGNNSTNNSSTPVSVVGFP